MKKVISLLLIPIFIIVAFSGCFSDNEPTRLSNLNANQTTQKIYEYLFYLSGEHALSAQQESTWMDSSEYEMDYIFDKTGKYPAMRGLDYMNDDFQGVNERALKWWNNGGLVTICWHTGMDFSGAWEEAKDDNITDWEAVLKDGTDENKKFIEGMDKAARALAELRDKGVTVIWRPFHEFDGGWFWWGKGGAENFIKLWRMMYERYTNYWELDNLIWVLGYSHNGKDYDKWYPGDDYCDIIGADSYDGGAQRKLYNKVKSVNKNKKPMCFHECGANPTSEELKKTPWIWFMTWHTEYLIDNNDDNALKELYNSDYIITLDELDINSIKAS
ncbi:MAG: glycoside hydrolase family 26 protein [Clostridiales bacterium]|nr:glycoside hydrolase family 26 protein [Clostridiales bacterium]